MHSLHLRHSIRPRHGRWSGFFPSFLCQYQLQPCTHNRKTGRHSLPPHVDSRFPVSFRTWFSTFYSLSLFYFICTIWPSWRSAHHRPTLHCHEWCFGLSGQRARTTYEWSSFRGHQSNRCAQSVCQSWWFHAHGSRWGQEETQGKQQ